MSSAHAFSAPRAFTLRSLAAAVLALSACGSVGTEECNGASCVDPTGTEAIDQFYADLLQEWDVPGAAIGVVREGNLVVANAYGVADRDTGEPVQPDDLFRIGGVSKILTAAAVLQLVDGNLLDFQDLVFTLRDDLLPATGPEDERVRDITVKHLLHHTAGWNRNVEPDPSFRQREVADALGVASPPSAEDIVRWLTAQPLQFTPGTSFQVHNVTYTILGRLIETVTGMTYDEYVTAEVLAPAGVTRARLGGSRLSERAEDEVVYYADDFGLFQSVFDDDPGDVPAPYGGMGALEGFDAAAGWIASVIDLLRVALALNGDPETPQILSSEMRDYAVAFPGQPFLSTPWYGAGRWVDGMGGWYNTGSLPGSLALLWIQPDGTIIAAATNKQLPGSDGDLLFQDFFIGTVNAVGAVTEWPTEDLFGRFN